MPKNHQKSIETIQNPWKNNKTLEKHRKATEKIQQRQRIFPFLAVLLDT